MIRRKQFNYFNDFAGEMILEYKETGSVCMSDCVYSLQCSLTASLLKASIKQFEGLCHQDPEPMD